MENSLFKQEVTVISTEEKTKEIEKILEKTINPGDIVFFIDGNSENIKKENLWLTNNKGLKEAEMSLKDQVPNLIKLGYLKFDRLFGLYKTQRTQRRVIIQSQHSKQPIPIEEIKKEEVLKTNKIPVVKFILKLFKTEL